MIEWENCLILATVLTPSNMAQLSSSTSTPRRAQQSRSTVMTEAQIVTMDAASYMSADQLQFFNARLVAIEEMLVSRIDASASEFAGGTIEADPIDRASVEEEHQLAMANRARDHEQLVEVRGALRRIKAGEFGWCLETGEMIGIARLLVRPTAVLCVEAQQRRESNNSRYRS